MRKIHWINGALALLLVGLIVADEVVPYVDTETGKVWPPAVEARIKTGESVQGALAASGSLWRAEWQSADTATVSQAVEQAATEAGSLYAHKVDGKFYGDVPTHTTVVPEVYIDQLDGDLYAMFQLLGFPGDYLSQAIPVDLHWNHNMNVLQGQRMFGDGRYKLYLELTPNGDFWDMTFKISPKNEGIGYLWPDIRLTKGTKHVENPPDFKINYRAFFESVDDDFHNHGGHEPSIPDFSGIMRVWLVGADGFTPPEIEPGEYIEPLATEKYVEENYFSNTKPVLFAIGEESVTLSVDGLSIENGAEDFIRLDSGFSMFADDTMVTLTDEGLALPGAAALKLSIWDKWGNRNNGISFHTFGLSLFDSAPPYPETHWDFRREAGTFQPAAMSDLSAAISQVNWPSEDIATNIIWSVVVSNGHWLIYGEAKP